MLRGLVLFTLCLMLVLSGTADAQKTPAASANPGAYITECMKMTMEGKQTHLVIWMPFEFMVEAGMQQNGGNREAAEKEMAVLKPYVLMAVQATVEAEDGEEQNSTAAELRARAVLVSPSGEEVAVADKVPPKVSVMAGAMATAMQGKAKDVHLLIFRNADSDGKPVVAAGQKGKLTLRLKKAEPFGEWATSWHTPLDAAAPPAPCTKCKEPVSAKWSFCPWCGAANRP